LHERFSLAAGVQSQRRGVEDAALVDQAMRELGARGRELAPVEDVRRRSVRAALADLEAGLYSNTWPASPEARARAAREVESWAESELGSLDAVREDRCRIAWRAYDIA
jgi:hypothetical protein